MEFKNNIGLVEYAYGQISRGYWYGTFGNYADRDLLEYKRKQYPEMYPPKKWTEESFVAQFGQKVHDCVGLIKAYMMCDSIDAPAKYNPKYDLSADGLIKICTDVVPYSKRPEVGGLVCWKKGHVGVYVLNGVTVEAKGHSFGVLETTNTKWEKVGRLPWVEYVDYTVFVKSLYVDVLGRKAEEEGLGFWVGSLRNNIYTVQEVAMLFFDSEEFKNRNLSDEEFIHVLYRTFFGRLPDAEGLRFWLERLKTEDRMYVVAAFVWSAEWQFKSKFIIPE